MFDQRPWDRSSTTRRRLLVAVGVLAAWGPGLFAGAVLWLVTGHVWAGALAFAVTCAITSIGLGAIGARIRAKRERPPEAVS